MTDIIPTKVSVKRIASPLEIPLPEDEFELGLYITVVQGPLFKGGMWDGCECRTYHGKVFKVLAINIPFVAAKWMELKDIVKAFDLREYKFVKLSDEYVNAMKINW